MPDAGLAHRPRVFPRRLPKLEESVGARLLHRSTHALSLTEKTGRRCSSRPVRSSVPRDTFRTPRPMQGGGAEKEIVRVSAPVAFVRRVLAPLAADFARVHPEIRLDVRASNEIVDLAEDGIDLALRSGSLAGVPVTGSRHGSVVPGSSAPRRTI